MPQGNLLAGQFALQALRADPAVQAALGLGDRLFLRKAEVDLAEVTAPLGRVCLRQQRPAANDHLAALRRAELLWLRPATPRCQILAAQVAVDRDGRFVPASDGLDHGACPFDHVAARESSRRAGRHCQRVSFDGPVSPDLDSTLVRFRP